jgi:murein DD-endopeptidase MepM/ murein hydrolase activator NlpD
VVTAAAAVAAAVVFGLPAVHGGTAANTGQTAGGAVADSLAGNTVGQHPGADAAKSSRLSTAGTAKHSASKTAAKASSGKTAKASTAKASPQKTAAKAAPSKTPAKASAATTRHAAKARTATTNAVYLNPLRKISGLMVERIDMGADFGGSGPVYAIGDGVITNATADSPGWPGGGWITYQLTDGPAKGLVVYLAEDVTPTVQVGQHVTPNTVIANMYNGSAGIETGWAMSDGSSAESQLPAAGGISGGGPFPTAVGKNFAELLNALGVPLSPFNGTAATYGVVPAGYPGSYSSLKS